jgi:inosose dehydratase
MNDVDLGLARQVQCPPGAVRAVQPRRSVTACTARSVPGDVDVAAIVGYLRRQGHDGWYVLEQDTVLTEEPRVEGPAPDVHTSAAYLQRLISGSG